MSKGKHAPKGRGYKLGNIRPLVLSLAIVLIIGCAVSGTVAWLTAEDDPVTNTFTIGNIGIELEGSALSADKKFVPGETIEFNPTVKVTDNSEPCYLFIHVEEENNTVSGVEGKVIKWQLAEAEGWQATGVNGYFYKKLDGATDVMDIIEKVSVNENLTKDKVDNMAMPKITVYAAAVQANAIPHKDGNELYLDAWELLPDGFKPATNP